MDTKIHKEEGNEGRAFYTSTTAVVGRVRDLGIWGLGSGLGLGLGDLGSGLGLGLGLWFVKRLGVTLTLTLTLNLTLTLTLTLTPDLTLKILDKKMIEKRFIFDQ